MQRLEIMVTNMNDSFSRVVLDGKPYLIRFTFNDTANRWSFGLYTMQKKPLAVGLRMVPHFPLNLQIMDDNFPLGVFGVYTHLSSIGRNDFKNGNAIFAYISAQQEDSS